MARVTEDAAGFRVDRWDSFNVYVFFFLSSRRVSFMYIYIYIYKTRSEGGRILCVQTGNFYSFFKQVSSYIFSYVTCHRVWNRAGTLRLEGC